MKNDLLEKDKDNYLLKNTKFISFDLQHLLTNIPSIGAVHLVSNLLKILNALEIFLNQI